jgi:hypothetical protein
MAEHDPQRLRLLRLGRPGEGKDARGESRRNRSGHEVHTVYSHPCGHSACPFRNRPLFEAVGAAGVRTAMAHDGRRREAPTLCRRSAAPLVAFL